jgi:hypothetical protein
MPKISSFLFLIFLFSPFPIFAQTSVIITPKKTIYTRKQPKIDAWKKRVEVRYPIVSRSAALAPATKRKLENTISYWRVFETSLAESLSETWLDSLDYAINYNKNSILDISLTIDGSGAYPDATTRNIIVNLKTGEQVKFSDVFKTEMREKLAEMADRKLQIEKKELVAQIEKGDETREQKDSLKEQINALKFTVEDFDEFSVGDKGATIFYDARFPHVIRALQPDGRYFFSYNELKFFIKTDSVLSQFIR